LAVAINPAHTAWARKNFDGNGSRAGAGKISKTSLSFLKYGVEMEIRIHKSLILLKQIFVRAPQKGGKRQRMAQAVFHPNLNRSWFGG